MPPSGIVDTSVGMTFGAPMTSRAELTDVNAGASSVGFAAAPARRSPMTKVLVLYYSSYGHVEIMAYAEAEGARAGGADAVVKRVPELVPLEIARKSDFKLDQAAQVATVDELADYDAIIFGSPTRFGSVTGQMRNFLDQAGGLWAQGKLVGKVGSAFTSTATQHGGQESTILTFIPTLMHFGMVVVGLPYAFQGQMSLSEIMGGSPYGAATISGADGRRQPSAIELEAARFQGRHVATIAAKLAERAGTAATEDRLRRTA
jgi:NAD(P)H dehydrogenase (quinone)